MAPSYEQDPMGLELEHIVTHFGSPAEMATGAHVQQWPGEASPILECWLVGIPWVRDGIPGWTREG